MGDENSATVSETTVSATTPTATPTTTPTTTQDAASECEGMPGRVAPRIDRNRCEGKEDCVTVCPYDVFEMATLMSEHKKKLSLKGRIKSWAHGGRQAFATGADGCRACQLCVAACPEEAIRLVPFGSHES